MRRLVSVLFALIAGSAGADEVQRVLAAVRARYAAITSAAITVRTYRRFTRTDQAAFHGTVLFAAPSSVRVQLYDGPRLACDLTTDGRFMNLGARPHLRQRPYSTRLLHRVLPVNLECINLWNSAEQMSTAEDGLMANSILRLRRNVPWNGRHWLVLHEQADSSDVECEYFIDPATYLMWRTRVTQISSGVLLTDSKIERLEINRPLPLTLFKVEPLGLDGP